jgi:hypothetical protein
MPAFYSAPALLHDWIKDLSAGSPVSTAGFQRWLASHSQKTSPVSRAMVDQALSRAVAAGRLVRVAPGLFVCQKKEAPLVWPLPEEALAAWGEQTGEACGAAGVAAAWLLDPRLVSPGTRPARWQVWTVGSSRTLTLGSHVLEFHHVAPRWLSVEGKAGLALRYLKSLGQSGATPVVLNALLVSLPDADRDALLASPHLSGWMRERIVHPGRPLWGLSRKEMGGVLRSARRNQQDVLGLVETWTRQAGSLVRPETWTNVWPAAWQVVLKECNIDHTTVGPSGQPLLPAIVDMLARAPLAEHGRDRKMEIGSLWADILKRWPDTDTLHAFIEKNPARLSLWRGLLSAWVIPESRASLVVLDEKKGGSLFLRAGENAISIWQNDMDAGVPFDSRLSVSIMGALQGILEEPDLWINLRTTPFDASQVVSFLESGLRLPWSARRLQPALVNPFLEKGAIVWDDAVDALPEGALDRVLHAFPVLGRLHLGHQIVPSSIPSHPARQRI